MRLTFCRCGYDTVIKRTFRSAAFDGREMTLWVMNDRFAVAPPCPLLPDCVAKVVLHWWSEILRAADAIFVQRCGGLIAPR